MIAFSATCFSQESSIKGSISGIKNANLQIMVLPLKLGETPIMGKIQCIDGKFEYHIKFNQNMWHLVRINSSEFNDIFGAEKSSNQKLKNREFVFFIHPNDKLDVKSKIANYGINYQVLGNNINFQRNQFAQKLFPWEEEFNRLTILMDKFNPNDLEIKETENQIKSVNMKLDSIRLKMIGMHLDWLYSAETLAGFPEDTIANYFKLLTSDVQNSFFWDSSIQNCQCSTSWFSCT